MDDFGFRRALGRSRARETTSIPLNACEVCAFTRVFPRASVTQRDGFADSGTSDEMMMIAGATRVGHFQAIVIARDINAGQIR